MSLAPTPTEFPIPSLTVLPWPDVVIDTQNGLPFLARLLYGRRVAMLVHHCHREQWPVAGPVLSRIGWLVESRLSPWLNRRNQYLTVSWNR